MRRVLVLGASTLLALVLSAGTALAAPDPAERSVAEDRNDTRGKMDVAEARYVHEPGEPPWWRVVTYAEWRPREIWDQGYVWIELDTRYGETADFSVMVRADRDRLRGDLFRVATTGRTTRIGSLDVWRSSSRSVAVRVALHKLTFGEGRTTFRWWVVTSFVGDVCRKTCFDLVPNDPVNAIEQDAPGGPPPA